MIRLATTAMAVALAFSTPAAAQSSLDAAPQGFDWTGIYGGVSYSMGYEPAISYELIPNSDTTTMEASAVGFFGGYNHQFGQIVAGAEIHAVVYNAPTVRFSADRLGGIFEARIRGGYAFDRVLVTASVGYAEQTYIAILSRQARMQGVTYGIGVDYALPNNTFVGAEYVMRDMSGPFTLATVGDISVEDETFRIRFGFRF